MKPADPTLYQVDIYDKDAIKQWRDVLRVYLVKKRKFKCDYCGKELAVNTGFDLHEGILTRRDVQGAKWKGLIFTEVNCFVVHPQCHLEIQNNREWAWETSCKRYGEKTVRDWYYGLPYKGGKPPRGF